jgi:hypothetical protein
VCVLPAGACWRQQQQQQQQQEQQQVQQQVQRVFGVLVFLP